MKKFSMFVGLDIHKTSIESVLPPVKVMSDFTGTELF